MEQHFNHTKQHYQDRATSTHEWYTVDDDSNIHQTHANIAGVPSQEFANSPLPSTSKFPGNTSDMIKYLSTNISSRHSFAFIHPYALIIPHVLLRRRKYLFLRVTPSYTKYSKERAEINRA